ncbi:hypothetical protein D3C87_1899430 [compost metagenome]
MSQGDLPLSTGVNGVILSSLTSILINIPLIRSMSKDKNFKRRVFLSLLLIAILGIVGMAINEAFVQFLLPQ